MVTDGLERELVIPFGVKGELKTYSRLVEEHELNRMKIAAVMLELSRG